METRIIKSGQSFPAQSIYLDGTLSATPKSDGPGVIIGVRTAGGGTGPVEFGVITGLPTTLGGYGITDAASDAELATHAADTTGIHGIADTSDLATISGLGGAAYSIDALGISWGVTNAVVYSDNGSGTAYAALGAANTVLRSNGVSSAPTFAKIVNADIDAAAAIAVSKISGLATVATSGSASDLGTGTLPDGRFPATLPAASGVNLTALNASNLGSGTVPDARFPATLPAASGVNLTALNASNLASGNIAYARLPNAGGTWNAGGGVVAITGSLTLSASGGVTVANGSGFFGKTSGGVATNILSITASDNLTYGAITGIGNSNFFTGTGDHRWHTSALSPGMILWNNGNLKLGGSVDTGHKIQLAASTAESGGIVFGTDAVLYRIAANELGTGSGDSFTVASALKVGGALDHDGSTVGLYGVTPVTRAAAITAVTNTATGTELATAINAIRVALSNIGITS